MTPATNGAQSVARVALPPLRPIVAPPVVADAGTLPHVDGAREPLNMTANFAVSDLRFFDEQVDTRYPFSGDVYPEDSIRAAKVARARQWLVRLDALQNGGGDGRHLMDRAEVAFRAERDSLARRYIDTRLAALPKTLAGNVARSEVLAAAITLFADADQDSTRLVRNLPLAELYARQLSAIAPSGYPTRSDSTDILYRQYNAFLILVYAADAAQQPTRVLQYATTFATFLERLNYGERRNAVTYEYPHREVASAFVRQPRGRVQLDSLNTYLLSLLADRPTDVGRPSPARRAALLAERQEVLRDRFAFFAAIGQPAPAVTAHAWLNTADSIYASTPRQHPLNDGIVRILAFQDSHALLLSSLERLGRELPSSAQVVVVTQTVGSIDYVITAPADEVAWLATYYRQKRHVTIPVAVWAGARVPGDYGTKFVAPSPVGPAFHAGWLEGAVVLVDGRGIVRAYLPFSDRADEARLIRRVRALVAESHAAESHS